MGIFKKKKTKEEKNKELSDKILIETAMQNVRSFIDYKITESLQKGKSNYHRDIWRKYTE